MEKVQIAAPRKAQEDLLQFLQEEEVLHIVDTPEHEHAPNSPEDEQQTAYRLAQLQFVLEFIQRVRGELNEPVKRSWKDMFSPKPAAALEELETTLERLDVDALIERTHERSEKLTTIQARIQEIDEEIERVQPWIELEVRGEDIRNTESAYYRLVMVDVSDETALRERIEDISSAAWQEVSRTVRPGGVRLYAELVAHPSQEHDVEQYLQDMDAEFFNLDLAEHQTPAERTNALQEQRDALQSEYDRVLADARELYDKETDLQFAYDALLHRQERQQARAKLASFDHALVVTGWIPAHMRAPFEQRLGEHIPSAAVETIEPEEDEQPPVMFKNSKEVQAFEAITDIYGRPAYNELDPSGALSFFFLISFGLALSDAGYGILMVVGMWIAQKYFRLKRDMRKMVRLLLYSGVATAAIGALTGGWFGIQLENLPAGPVRDALLSVKLIDPVSQPLDLLLVAFAIGVVQLLFARVMSARHHYHIGKVQNIYLDDIPWMTMIVFLLTWAGARQGVLPDAVQTPFGWLTVANAVFLVFTQGRSQKNPFVRFGAGVLSLYGLVDFMSDTLSYSRLLALGLATAIIGLVVNLIASMVASIPVAGLVLAGVVLLVGHVFNLGINALGAFIHSGRLQFVEFFPKFIEGGGAPFKPLGRVSKYVDNPKEFHA